MMDCLGCYFLQNKQHIVYSVRNLRSLLQHKQYVEALLTNYSNPDVLSNFCDGKRCKEHSLFGDDSKVSIKLQLFYDGMGTTNPLRGQSTLCNIVFFYYVVKNLPDSFNTCFANVHLLALCYTK